jgi:cytochrome P450
MYQVLEEPQKWYLSLARYSSSVILSVVFGIRAKMYDSAFMTIFETMEDFVPYTMPGHAKVDSLPFLTQIPYLKSFQPWRWKADKIYRDTLRLVSFKSAFQSAPARRQQRRLTLLSSSSRFHTLLDQLDARIQAGTQVECFMTELLQNKEQKFTRDEIAFIAVTLLEAGSDTTRLTMISAIAAAAMYPEWVLQARAQLDEVCGKNAERLPTFADIDKLPYIQAVAKEATRWR